MDFLEFHGTCLVTTHIYIYHTWRLKNETGWVYIGFVIFFYYNITCVDFYYIISGYHTEYRYTLLTGEILKENSLCYIFKTYKCIFSWTKKMSIRCQVPGNARWLLMDDRSILGHLLVIFWDWNKNETGHKLIAILLLFLVVHRFFFCLQVQTLTIFSF